MSNEIQERIKVNGRDVLMFLAGDERFCNMTELWQATAQPRSFDQYLKSSHGRAFIEEVSERAEVPPGRLYYYDHAESCWWASHEIALDYAGWISPRMRMLYYQAVKEWAADKLDGGSIAAEYANDPIIATRIAMIQLERKVDAEREARIALERKVDDGNATIAMALDTIDGKHGWYALAPWAAKVARINLSEREAKEEAMHILIPMCRRRGIQPQKVGSAKFVQVNSYPEDILREWATDYRRRFPHAV